MKNIFDITNEKKLTTILYSINAIFTNSFSYCKKYYFSQICNILKKLTFLFLLFLSILKTPSFADDLIEELDSNELNESLIETSSQTSNEPKIHSKHAIIFDRTSGHVLFEKNAYEQTPMASTTKIMTALVIIENCTLSDTVTISKKAGNTGGSRLGLHSGDKITVNDLLYGLMLRSGNDAAVALAEFASGSVENFAMLMNEKAIDLNLTHTHFTSPHGLDDENHYTTAYELALLANYAMENEIFQRIVNTKSTTIHINQTSTSIHNTNELLGNLNGVYGIKTGFTNNAGRCLVTACKRNNIDIITVVLGADTKKIRTSDSIKLIEYTFSNFSTYNAKDDIENYFNNWCQTTAVNISIHKTNSPLELSIENSDNYIFLVENHKKNNAEIFIDCTTQSLEAPLPSGFKIATLYLKNDSQILLSLSLTLKSPLYRKSISDYFKDYFFHYTDFLENSFSI